jgi:methyl-accepting chemotaxis protein
MSYYDEPETIIHARIASERSGITDLKYTYKKVITSIMTSNPEDITDDMIQKQLDIIQQLKERKQNIALLEYQLEALTLPVVVPPVVDLSNNVLDLSNNVVDLSNNVLDLSNNVVDLSNNVLDLSNNVVDLSNNVLDLSNNVLDLSNNIVDLSNNVVDLSNNVVDLSNNIVDASNNVLDLSNNVLDLSNNVLDLSNNEVVPPLIQQEVPPLVDLSNNVV